MATITQVASGSVSNSSAITLSNISYQPRDAFVLVSSSYSIAQGSAVFSNGQTLPFLTGNTITTTNPDLTGRYYQNTEMTGSLTNGTLTWTQSGTESACVILFRIRPDPFKKIVSRSVVRDDDSGTTGSISTIVDPLQVVEGSILVGAGAVADDTYFTDSDTLNGSWSSSFIKTNTTGDDIGVFGQTKITSGGTGTQTLNGTWANSGTETAVLFLGLYYEIDDPYWGMAAIT